MRSKRVVVTGMGAISGAGIGVDVLWSAARLGKTAVSEVELERPGRNIINIAAQLKNFNPIEHIEKSTLLFCDRFSQFAIIAADEAILQAKLSRDKHFGERCAVIIGTAVGGFTTLDDTLFTYNVLKTRINPMTIPLAMNNAATSQLCMRYGCTGPAMAVSSACSSSSQAIGLGALLIRSGAIDRAIVGGSEACITETYIRGWEVLRVLSSDFCRPFSSNRNGMILGEGAGIFILENAEAAKERGALALAEIAGYGTSSDANDIVRPDVDGEAAAMRKALEDAKIKPEAINYINAHGTGTVMNDIVESDAMRQIFGSHLDKIAVSSTKPIHGHALGASSALELAITIMALRENIAPPTINWLGPDPKCIPDPVPNQLRKLSISAAMSNSFAFGGINASIIVTEFN